MLASAKCIAVDMALQIGLTYWSELSDHTMRLKTRFQLVSDLSSKISFFVSPLADSDAIYAGSEVFGLKALAATASLPSKSPSQPPIARAGSILSAKASGKRKRSADAGLDEQARQAAISVHMRAKTMHASETSIMTYMAV